MTLASRYEELLTRSRGLTLVDLGRPQLRAAAQLRALRTPVVLQMATALGSGCSALVTNGRRLPSVSGLRILRLTAYR